MRLQEGPDHDVVSGNSSLSKELPTMTFGPGRNLYPELASFAAGVALAIVAHLLSLGWLFILGIVLALCSPLAAFVTLTLSRASTKVQVILFSAGIIVGAVGVFSANATADSPEVFSWALLMYLGGAFALSTAMTLLHRGARARR